MSWTWDRKRSRPADWTSNDGRSCYLFRGFYTLSCTFFKLRTQAEHLHTNSNCKLAYTVRTVTNRAASSSFGFDTFQVFQKFRRIGLLGLIFDGVIPTISGKQICTEFNKEFQGCHIAFARGYVSCRALLN